MPTRGTTSYSFSIFPYNRFQSTCPRGARRSSAVLLWRLMISIHVPTRGTTQLKHKNVIKIKFQSTCPRGARRSAGSRFPHQKNFNPRAHEGHDPPINPPIPWSGFQSTCPRGARQTISAFLNSRYDFNPRAHEGHDVNSST